MEINKKLKCKTHGKGVKITTYDDGRVNYEFCCQSFRSEFFKIIELPKKKP